MNLDEFKLENAELGEYDRENLSSYIANIGLETLFNQCKAVILLE